MVRDAGGRYLGPGCTWVVDPARALAMDLPDARAWLEGACGAGFRVVPVTGRAARHAA